jgi:hypothetical protein
MHRAQRRGAVRTGRFFFRKDVLPAGDSPDASRTPSECGSACGPGSGASSPGRKERALRNCRPPLPGTVDLYAPNGIIHTRSVASTPRAQQRGSRAPVGFALARPSASLSCAHRHRSHAPIGITLARPTASLTRAQRRCSRAPNGVVCARPTASTARAQRPRQWAHSGVNRFRSSAPLTCANGVACMLCKPGFPPFSRPATVIAHPFSCSLSLLGRCILLCLVL